MDAPIFLTLPDGPDRVAPFSHAVRVGPWLLVTGQMPTDPTDNLRPLPEGIEAQTRQVMAICNGCWRGRAMRCPMSCRRAST